MILFKLVIISHENINNDFKWNKRGQFFVFFFSFSKCCSQAFELQIIFNHSYWGPTKFCSLWTVFPCLWNKHICKKSDLPGRATKKRTFFFRFFKKFKWINYQIVRGTFKTNKNFSKFVHDMIQNFYFCGLDIKNKLSHCNLTSAFLNLCFSEILT